MSLNVDLPSEAQARLETEAARRGVTVDEVIAELAAALPSARPQEPQTPRFVGIGASGDTRPFDIHRERAELAARRMAEGA